MENAMNVYRMYYIYSWFLSLCPVVMCVCLFIYNKVTKPKKTKIVSDRCFFLALPGQKRYYADKETIVKLKVLYVTNVDEASTTCNKEFEKTPDGEFFTNYHDAVIYRRKLRKAWERSLAPKIGSFIAYKKVSGYDVPYEADDYVWTEPLTYAFNELLEDYKPEFLTYYEDSESDDDLDNEDWDFLDRK